GFLKQSRVKSTPGHLLTEDLVVRSLALLLLVTPAFAAELRVGAAAVVINPPEGTPLAGYYSQRGSKTVLDDIHAKAIVLEVGDTKAALVVCDLISLPRHVVSEARRQVEAATGIPGAHVMISATHTHTGPVIARESALAELVGATSAPRPPSPDNPP